MKNLNHILTNFLTNKTDNENIIKMFQRVRSLQKNGRRIDRAIQESCDSFTGKKPIKISRKKLHKDNAPAHLAIRFRAKLLQLRSEGHGYGTIAKMLAQTGGYNKKTRKKYSRSTIQRAIALLEKGVKK